MDLWNVNTYLDFSSVKYFKHTSNLMTIWKTGKTFIPIFIQNKLIRSNFPQQYHELPIQCTRNTSSNIDSNSYRQSTMEYRWCSNNVCIVNQADSVTSSSHATLDIWLVSTGEEKSVMKYVFYLLASLKIQWNMLLRLLHSVIKSLYRGIFTNI